MTRRILRAAPAWALAALLAAACGGRREEPTVVLVVVDTLRRDALSCYGGPPAATPELDALAAEGARFEQAIASSCWTLPSVASLLTGTWPELHKAVGRRTLLSPVSDRVPLAAEVFREAGWATVAVVNAAFLSPLLGLGRGFDVYDHEHAFNRTVRRADETVEAALALAARAGERPLFLLVHLFDPHLDYDPPPELSPAGATPITLSAARALAPPGGRPEPAEEARVRAMYAAEVASVDRAIGRLRAGLRELGLWERAIVVVTADHGEELWDHGGFEHGHTLYDELVRVPLIVKLPGGRRGGRGVVGEQVRSIDVLPTLLELCGIGAPASVEGRSLMALIEGRSDAPRAAFCQDTLYGTDRISWRTERYHYLYDRGAGVERRAKLFEHRADPGEQVDLVEREPEVAEEMHRQLAEFYAGLRERGARVPETEAREMGPSAVREVERSLESLGYVGRGE